MSHDAGGDSACVPPHALRGYALLADGERAQATEWSGLADAIAATPRSTRCIHRAAGSAQLPTAGWTPRCCCPPVRGAVPADDPRTLETLRAYTAELTQDGYAYRFRHDDRPLQAAEGAFLLCGFVLALALHQQGQEVDAARWFERNRAACGTPGLYAEEYDVSERQLRGNLPQAFVHALMLECAARLNSPWKPEWRTGQDDGQCPDEED